MAEEPWDRVEAMIKIINGDLLTQPVDAIVNAANGHLRHGGGLARAIADAAAPTRDHVCPDVPGTQVRKEWDQDKDWLQEQVEHPLIATGNVGLTSAGRLPYRGIIHAVAPIWNGGNFYETDLLRKAYARTFIKAVDNGFVSIAVPALGMGIFGCPRGIVSSSLFSAYYRSPERERLDVVVCLTNDDDVAHFKAQREAVRDYIAMA